MESIVTPRCIIRALETGDIEPMYIWENDPEIWRIGANTAYVSKARLARFIEEQNYDIYATHQMRLVVEVEGRVVGAVDITDFNPQHLRFSLGILIYDKSDRRKGYAREVIEAMKEYGLYTLNLKQIWVEIDAFNTASIALFESCGFERCGVRKEWICYGGAFYDVYEYQAILR
jgi:diamine N-acetyltransferase